MVGCKDPADISGHSRGHHIKNVIHMLWPEVMNSWNDWNELALWAFTTYDEIGVTGCAAAGKTFTFTLQGDSHPERPGNMFNSDLYARNMRNVAAREPDFYIALGDDFSVENILTANTLSASTVDALYANQRTFFGLLGHSTPVFLVNGLFLAGCGAFMKRRMT